MSHKRTHRKIGLGFLSAAVFVLLAALTVLAHTFSNQTVYLPLILAQYPPPPSGTTKLLITEVLYNPSSEPAGEWVEIYNPGAGVAILSSYKLGDEEYLGYDEGMLQFPPGAVLDPGGVIVVANQAAVFRSSYGFPPDFEMRDSDPAIPDMLPYYAWSTGSKVELVNSGDELLLLDGEDTIIDALSWGNSTWEQAFDPPPPIAGDGQSLERSPAYKDSDSASDWGVAETPGPYQLDLSTPTPTVSPTPIIPTGPTILLVSEVLYDPSGADPAGEWIEIYNAGENNAALWLYRLGDEEAQGGGEGMYFFPPGAVLLAGETAVIARDALTFETLYGFKPDFEIPNTDPIVPDMIKDSGWASGSLSMSLSGDEVLLLGEEDALVD
ncbi:MAG: lamin tail domain-containing protein, partial [Chloroflexi bacterium]|nr:lamin tail domain-containing protein [Chloroflexota bacterium]